ncbi:MAG: glycerophosphodiester phosphodiesterase, partial [Actinobacteria bacterium]|nr:glycerophosphodiester phosphodiesterase [Actinomycetota bacterium]
GADGFECDVRLTKDKQIICYHDKNTKRLSNLDLEIAKSTYNQLKESINPLRLNELLDLAILKKKDLVIEFKHPVPTRGEVEKQVHKLLDSKKVEITKSGIKVLLISFSYLATLRNKKSTYSSGYLISRKALARFNPTKYTVANIEIIKSDHSFVKIEKSKGKQVIAWTVNELSDLKLCQELGLFAVITDYPARARKHLGYS